MYECVKYKNRTINQLESAYNRKGTFTITLQDGQ